jgi:hypothetical protein
VATAAELRTAACTSGIACLGDRALLVAVAQALATDLDMTAAELRTAACASGIACLGERDLLIAIAEGINSGGGGGGGGTVNYSGAGSPEGVQTAAVNSVYRDTATGALWWKVSGAGNTGWEQMTGPF